MMRCAARLFAALTLVALAPACDDPAADGAEDLAAEAVLPGKADNYLSPTSREYHVWGMGQIDLDRETWASQDPAAKEAHVREQLGYRVKAYAHFVNAYLTDKGHGATNADYGGFGGLVHGKSTDFVIDPVDADQLAWAFIWELELGAPRDLLDRVPLETGANGDQVVVVQIPALSESDLEYARYPKDFDPSKYTGAMEELEVVVEPKSESSDGYPEYDRLFADGRFDVTIVVGGDYNAERYDLQQAEAIFAWLKSAGYKHAAAKYTELKVDSPPFTGKFTAQGRTVEVAITLLHPAVAPVAELDLLRQRIIEAYEQDDVVIYDGHAGEDPDYSGIVYHYNPRHAISASGLAQLDLPEAKYQIFLFNGCKTYAAYPDAVMKNPRKTTKTLDIVSTVNFSWLNQQTFTTSGFIRELLAKSGATHDPRTWREVLTSINAQANANVYYGVHGIDDNPHLNPYADVASLCRPCAKDADCPGAGNLCLAFSGGKKHCTAECTADDGCPDGYVCGDIAAGGRIIGKQCMPKTYRCP